MGRHAVQLNPDAHAQSMLFPVLSMAFPASAAAQAQCWLYFQLSASKLSAWQKDPCQIVLQTSREIKTTISGRKGECPAFTATEAF